MIAQDFITNTLARNPSITELAELADALDRRAGECFDIARVAKTQHIAAVAVRFNDIGINAQDTCDALRAIVYEAARNLAVPDWAYEADEVALADAERAHSQLDAA